MSTSELMRRLRTRYTDNHWHEQHQAKVRELVEGAKSVRCVMSLASTGTDDWRLHYALLMMDKARSEVEGRGVDCRFELWCDDERVLP